MKKNLFTNYRLFTLKISPWNSVINRSREDFKWLSKKLKEDNPTALINRLGNGELSGRIIERFFMQVFKNDTLLGSQHLRFFLTADDSNFIRRRGKEMGWLNKFAQKLGIDEDKPANRENLEENKDLTVKKLKNNF